MSDDRSAQLPSHRSSSSATDDSHLSDDDGEGEDTPTPVPSPPPSSPGDEEQQETPLPAAAAAAAAEQAAAAVAETVAATQQAHARALASVIADSDDEEETAANAAERRETTTTISALTAVKTESGSSMGNDDNATKVPLPKFNGDKASYRQWMALYENFCKRTKIPDAERGEFLQYAFKDCKAAATWFNTYRWRNA